MKPPLTVTVCSLEGYNYPFNEMGICDYPLKCGYKRKKDALSQTQQNRKDHSEKSICLLWL